ncbi:MAG: hypothetical protein RBU21_23100 [FCB group bacterium]|nr:hypothetical protein [FCB group bacterium]
MANDSKWRLLRSGRAFLFLMILGLTTLAESSAASERNSELYLGVYSFTQAFSQETGQELSEVGVEKALHAALYDEEGKARLEPPQPQYEVTIGTIGELGYSRFNDELWSLYSRKPLTWGEGGGEGLTFGDGIVGTASRIGILRALLRCGDERALPPTVELALDHRNNDPSLDFYNRMQAVKNLKYAAVSLGKDVCEELTFCAQNSSDALCRSCAYGELLDLERFYADTGKKPEEQRYADARQRIETMASPQDAANFGSVRIKPSSWERVRYKIDYAKEKIKTGKANELSIAFTSKQMKERAKGVPPQ